MFGSYSVLVRMRVSSWSGDFDVSRFLDFLKFFELSDEGDWLVTEGFWIVSGQVSGLSFGPDGTCLWHVDWIALVRLPPGGWMDDI